MMKKVMLGLIAAAVMTSCIKREEVATDQASNLGTATISGVVYANMINTNDTTSSNIFPDGQGMSAGDLENPSGVQVIATYSTNSLDPDNVNGETVSVSTTTDGSGAYTLSVEASSQANAVTIEFVTFNGDFSYNDGKGNNPITVDTETKTYAGATRNANVRNGETTVVNFVY